jgi:dTDP-4-dehydrorhamnose 3,5-epimerase
MIFRDTPIPGARLVELEPRGDGRGFFARMFCEQEFAAAGLPRRVAQANNSLSARRGTVRGMHYQLPPDAETKMVRCVRGGLFDVVLDLRPDSPTFGRWHGEELTADNRRMLVIPRGCAHGFVTLTDDAEVLYLVDHPYSPGRERGVRHDDPRFGIEWPVRPVEVSDKDRAWPSFDPQWHGTESLRGLL